MSLTVRPTLISAAVAGAVAALLWPYIWRKFGGTATGGSVELVVATLAVIALPAHAFVVGFKPTAGSAAGALNNELLKRIACWLGAAGAVTLVRSALGV